MQHATRPMHSGTSRLRRDVLVQGPRKPTRHALRRGVAAEMLRQGERAGSVHCEIQFCGVAAVTSSFIETRYYGYATGSGTAAHTSAPSVTEDVKTGPPEEVENCMLFVSEGDLPGGVSNEISDVSSWSVLRFYDDELPPEDVSAAV
ncbi:hypothetical protein F4823DRAFT_618643 [Ustulina deusta]|nr:hypothetical protein F4823DRAFT_618643 [Ustulina deusta]